MLVAVLYSNYNKSPVRCVFVDGGRYSAAIPINIFCPVNSTLFAFKVMCACERERQNDRMRAKQHFICGPIACIRAYRRKHTGELCSYSVLHAKPE